MLPFVLVGLLAGARPVAGDSCNAETGDGGSSGGSFFYLVKSHFEENFWVADPDTCEIDRDSEIVDFRLNLLQFTQGRTATIWNGSDDPEVRTSDPITELPPADIDGVAGWEGPYEFEARSLKDLGTYLYEFEGTFGTINADGDYVESPMENDEIPYPVDNDRPQASVEVSGPGAELHTNSTLTLASNEEDPDGGEMAHRLWTITGRPSSSTATLSGSTSEEATLQLSSKDDIGEWVVELELADDEGELRRFSRAFEVINRRPPLHISGPLTIPALELIHLEAAPETDDDGETITWEWDILASPAGATVQPQPGYSSQQILEVTTTPQDIGEWQIRCTGTDEHGGTTSQTVTVTVDAIPPQITLEGATDVDVGGAIELETTTLEDGYGAPLEFRWDVVQAPVTAGVGLVSGYSTGPALTIPATEDAAGTWIFHLTVTDQIEDTAEQEVTVLVDALPVARMTGPEQIDSPAFTLELDGGDSEDPDSPQTPPDFGHLHTDAVVISPGIARYQWSLLEVPPEHFGEQFHPGPVGEVLRVDGSEALLQIPPGRLRVGEWLFELAITDGEGNQATAAQWVRVLDTSLPPLAILTPPLQYLTTSAGLLPAEVAVDGSQSLDPDNLIQQASAPGLGILDYRWHLAFHPGTCLVPPSPPAGPDASRFSLFASGSQVVAACQGVYGVVLEIEDDDEPAPKTGSGLTQVVIGNCAGAVCIDYPTRDMPQFVKFSNQTDVIIYYHLNSLLYGDPVFTSGLRVRLELYHESDLVVPAYDATTDVDVLPSDVGGMLALKWSGHDNNGQRPRNGKYTIRLRMYDHAGNLTNWMTEQRDAIWIRRLDVQVASGTDAYLNGNGITAGTDRLHVLYQVGTQLPNDPGYDRLIYRIYNAGTAERRFEGTLSPPPSGAFDWNGDLGGGSYIAPGAYDLELEIRDGAAVLGVSPRHRFQVYRLGIELAGVPVADTLDPGDLLREGLTVDVSVKLEGDDGTLPGLASFKTEQGPGTLTAADAGMTVDIDGGVDIPLASLAMSKTYRLTAAAPGDGKTVVTLSYLPPGAPASKKAKASAGVTVFHARLQATGADPATQEAAGVFLPGSTLPPLVGPATFGFFKYGMRPLKLDVRPDLSGAEVELAFESGFDANLELYLSTPPNSRLTLPKTWTAAEFESHRLEVPLLAYGKRFGDAVLKLTYRRGGVAIHEERVKLRVSHFPGAAGVETAATFPYFRVVRTVNEGTSIKVALDPHRHKERLGRKASVYLVKHRTAAEWSADPTLADETGSVETLTLAAPSVANNVTTVWASATKGSYDVVYDFGNFADDPADFAADGRLDPGDILDSDGESASVVVEASMIAPGPEAVTSDEYGMPPAVPVRVTIPAGYDGLGADFDFRLRGRITYPTGLSTPAPLVAIAHGNHMPLSIFDGSAWVTVDPDITSDENFRGYAYLQDHLSSRGYVTLSVDLDEMLGSTFSGGPAIPPYGIGLRSWVLLKNIEKVLTDLPDKIDPTRIYLLGHSRGGEAVLVAYDQLRDPVKWPPAGTLAGIDATGVKGIMSLSPTTAVIGSRAPADVPFLLLYGSADGDVNGATSGEVMPFRHYDHSTGDRYAVRLEGGNHNNFNTSWGFDEALQTWDFDDPILQEITKVHHVPLAPPVGDPATLVPGTDQRDVAKGYVTAFLRMVEEADPGARGYFLEPPAALRPPGVASTLKLHGQADLAGVPKVVLDDYETNPATTLSSSGQTVTVSGSLHGVGEELLQDLDLVDELAASNRFFQETQGALFDWNSATSYTLALAPAEEDLRGAGVLSFRIAQQPKHAETLALAGERTLEVELEDAGGAKKAINVSILGSAPGIYEATVDGNDTTSAAFKTFRIPIAGFVTDGTVLDLSRIKKVRFKLGGIGTSARGRIGMDDVEIEK